MTRILDATAANRCMWTTKDSEYIIYIDIEPELNTAPDILMSCRHTGFLDSYFHTILFDPPTTMEE